jgi:hypothetical protein
MLVVAADVQPYPPTVARHGVRRGSETALLAQTLDVAMEGKMVRGDFVGLAFPGQLDGIRGASGRGGVLGDPDYLPPLVDQVPQSLELWIVTPTRHPETSRRLATYLGREPYSGAELIPRENF